MKSFFKPKIAKWIVFTILIILNVPIYFLTALQSWWLLWYAVVLQWLWLYALFGAFGFDVTGRGDYIKSPNFLGLILVIIGSLFTLTIYYFLASAIVHLLSGRKR
jgi:hypothetical protein